MNDSTVARFEALADQPALTPARAFAVADHPAGHRRDVLEDALTVLADLARRQDVRKTLGGIPPKTRAYGDWAAEPIPRHIHDDYKHLEVPQ